ncbi:MAG: hypothetical protein LBD76_06710 [Prevotellaceae bacterium]|jgi:L-asparagine transporter-like permease|nr:hypothetical protein [Prevotellaceae bacterium]
MFIKSPYIKRIVIPPSKINEENLKKLVAIEYRMAIIKIIVAILFLAVGVLLIYKDIQYADAHVNFKVPGVEIDCNRVIPGVLCLIFAFILFLFARVNIVVKQPK